MAETSQTIASALTLPLSFALYYLFIFFVVVVLPLFNNNNNNRLETMLSETITGFV